MTPTPAPDLQERMAAYAADLRQRGAIRTDTVERAFATVPRHLFIPGGFWRAGRFIPVTGQVGDDLLEEIYADKALMTHVPKDEDAAGRYSSTSQPRVIAAMLEALQLTPGLRVLEIGAGTGYNAGLITAITGAEVVTIDVSDVIVAEAQQAAQRAGATTVTALTADGYLGHPDRGPYDRIVVTCGITGISPHWLDQLTDDGLIVAPLAHGGFHPTLAITRADGELLGRGVMSSDFMNATGPLYAWPDGQTPALTEPLPAQPLTTRKCIGPVLTPERYYDLWFHLGTRSGRTTRAYVDGLDPALGMACLHDPDRGTAWIQHTGDSHFVGDPAVADELAARVQEWTDLDQPAIPDHHAVLEATDAEEPVFRPIEWHVNAGQSSRC
ncbi:methyltransferase domain-containing protein [Streptomyces ipomoeae]|uniref:protein-L-isoaspartate O-methyltransferase family protein n=1 Tax=Streptomyces ipomoeae TaxID=103232 RepID=UPI0029A7A1BC|nr:methyltransferase domain-containing protein [Streptomyces ipomoeae]MDX2819939.1 methyltransferase domain-containing protein [Streptomyces ipomoeae]MDX2872615.1 methyltransferase domain-containing protein [Streptomyces ipomoeae]